MEINKDIILNRLENRANLALKRMSERASIVKEFETILNASRREVGLKPLKVSFIGMRMAHLDLWDLKIFLGSCKDAKNFSKYWWYALKVK